MKSIYNAIIQGKWYTAGQSIPKDIVPPSLRKYEAIEKEDQGETTGEISLTRNYNQPYSVDAEGFLRPTVGRQFAEMRAETDFIEEQVADAPWMKRSRRFWNKHRKSTRLPLISKSPMPGIPLNMRIR